jgi:hypothetical protein
MISFEENQVTTLRRFILSALFLILSAHRSPAPIQEVTETPKPSPKPKASHVSKPKENASSSASAKPAKVSQSAIGGSWAGGVSTVAGNMESTMVIDVKGTSVKEISANFGTTVHPATWDGKTAKWHSGPANVYSWSFTPNPDGTTASVICNGPYITNPLTAFRRVSQ